ncbi:MAG: response regulator [Thermodesulfobacteriota bacterium]|nr:response regulator [Thermodesulfobacteriota bacterium]
MHILLAEDDQSTLRLMQNRLEGWGYTVHPVADGLEAWKKLKSAPVDIVVTDWVMPKLNGLELCERVRKARFGRYIYFILVTAQDSQQDIVLGLEAGVDDYVTKPVDFDEVRARLDIGARIVKLERELTCRYNVIRDNYFQTIRMFINLIEVFNEDLGGHCRRVAKLSVRLAKRFPEVSDKELSIVEATGLLHDIGMVGMPPSVLTKRMTEMNGDEKDLYKSHPAQGEIILKEIEVLQPISQLVAAHHEQFNGGGFPNGLEDHEIPLLAKIVSAADAYDNALHKWETPLEEIPDYLQRQRGYQLAPTLVDHLLEINLEDIEEERRKDFFEVLLDDVHEGMTLSRNVRMKNGTLIMPANTELTSYGIEKLKKYLDLKCISNKLYVMKN